MKPIFLFIIVHLTIILVYLIGQGLHIAMNAVTTIRSKLNAIDTWGQYFSNQGIFIAVRFFLTTAMFLIVWENPKLGNFDQWSLGPLTRIGLAGLLGYSMDSLFEKIAALIGIAPELPKG